MSQPPGSDRVRVRRQPGRGVYNRAAVEAVLDSGLVAHVAFSDADQPFCTPMLYARVGGSLLIHGSRASRAIRRLASGTPACVTVTTTDGLVLARSAFEHSANYRSVMLLGSFAPVPAEARLAALEAFTNTLVPGRWGEVREPNVHDLRATIVLSLPIGAASVQTRSGLPSDDESADAELDIWAGVVPIHTWYGRPQPSPGLKASLPLAESVRRLVAGSSDCRGGTT